MRGLYIRSADGRSDAAAGLAARAHECGSGPEIEAGPLLVTL